MVSGSGTSLATEKAGRFRVQTKTLPVSPRVLFFYSVASLALVWPALINGFPILFPDTMDYVISGDSVVAALLGRPTGIYGTRSVFFSLSIFPLHYFGGPWLMILAQALVASWTLKASLRLLWGEDRPRQALGLVLILSALSSISWTVSLILPDYLCGLMVLWIFLLCSERSSKPEKLLAAAFTWYAVVSHASHLALLLVLTPVVALFPNRKRALQMTLSVVLVALLSQLAFHGFLYGKPMLFGKDGPPFLTARLLADGTGVQMLEKHDNFTIARYDHLFLSDSDKILWGPGGLGRSLKSQNLREWKAIKAEEPRFVMATLRHDPMLQLRCSLDNWWSQCLAFEIELSRGSSFIDTEVKRLWPGQRDGYLNSLQNTADLPTWLCQFHRFSVVLSLLALLILGTRYRKTFGPHWLQLGVLIGSSYLMNAAITGILSKPTGRYQARLAWLICFMALAVGHQVFQGRNRGADSVDVVRS